jgi:hypothetical protein
MNKSRIPFDRNPELRTLAEPEGERHGCTAYCKIGLLPGEFTTPEISTYFQYPWPAADKVFDCLGDKNGESCKNG